MSAPEGLLLVDKPGGLTSHDVVSRTRPLARTRKVGHAGTLDPMATGLLVLGIGRATRLLTYLVGADKTYTATIRLGQGTTTDDAEGEITSRTGAELSLEAITPCVEDLTGPIQQVPSSVSAIKIDGQRAYARVRAGQDVQIPARPVTIHEFTLTDVRPAVSGDGVAVTDVDARIRCSSGTYIRALARDLGAALEVGGHLTALRRTEVGPFAVKDAMELPSREEIPARHEAPYPLTPPSFLSLADALTAAFPVRIADDAEARALGYGQAIPPSISPGLTGVLSNTGQALALVENAGDRAKPLLVLAPASV